MGTTAAPKLGSLATTGLRLRDSSMNEYGDLGFFAVAWNGGHVKHERLCRRNKTCHLRLHAGSTSSCTERVQRCDATLVSLLTRSGHLQPCAAAWTEPCCGWPSASTPRTVKSSEKATNARRAGLRGGRPLECPGPEGLAARAKEKKVRRNKHVRYYNR